MTAVSKLLHSTSHHTSLIGWAGTASHWQKPRESPAAFGDPPQNSVDTIDEHQPLSISISNSTFLIKGAPHSGLPKGVKSLHHNNSSTKRVHLLLTDESG